MKNPRTQPKNQSSHYHSKESDTKTFLEHVQELRNRLFWIVVVFIIASALAYPFFDKILDALVRPLGDQQLYYLTPAGGFSFILKVCMYTGMVAAIPMIIYQLFRYIQPVMGKVKHITILGYITASVILAVTGILLAYFVSLPAALHFLTDFNLPQISAMLTADSYFSFVMTYLVAAALLFQLPLILMIINSIKPMKPGGMMKQQRYVIVIAFILGAIISPTPDALNQALLAGPIVLMYQLGIFLVMIQNRLRRKRLPKVEEQEVPLQRPSEVKPTFIAEQPLIEQPESLPVKNTPQKALFSDIIAPSAPLPRPRSRIASPAARSTVRPPQRPILPRRKLNDYTRSIDGFAIDA